MDACKQKSALPRSLKLVDRGGKFVRRVPRDDAYQMLHRGGAVLRDGKVVQLVAPDERVYPGGRSRPTRYSHDCDSETNPRGVWELTSIPSSDRDLYTTVVDECLQRAA